MGNMNNYNTNSNTGPVCGGRAMGPDEKLDNREIGNDFSNNSYLTAIN